MSVFLLILKILLFLVLGLLAFVLLLLFMVLLVPFRYRGAAEFTKEKKEGSFRIYWLLHFLSVCAIIHETQVDLNVRLCGFRLKLFENEQETGKKKAEKTVTEKKKKKKKEKKVRLFTFYKKYAGLSFIDRMNEAWQDRKKLILLKLDLFSEKYRKFQKKLAFIQSPKTDRALKKALKTLKKVLSHIFPKKLSGALAFGLSSPDQTGKVLAVWGMLAPLHRDRFLVTPDFNEEVMEGNLELKGRIRLGSLVIYGIALILNKDFRITVKRIKNFASESGEVKNG